MIDNEVRTTHFQSQQIQKLSQSHRYSETEKVKKLKVRTIQYNHGHLKISTLDDHSRKTSKIRY